MKVLVTGGTGYIGSHTAVCLLHKGYEVVIADNLSNSHSFVLSHIEEITGTKPAFYQTDITDRVALQKLFAEEHHIDAVIHFAAFKSVGESVVFPLKYYTNNIQGLAVLLEVMLEHDCNKIIFSSSCSVYGNTTALPVTEETPFMPAESPYGYSKQVGEMMLRDVSKTGKLKSIALRYFNPVGAHETALLGEWPIGVPSNLVPVICQSAAGLRGPVTVFGNDYETPDGTCIRDYIHVMDLADAHVQALSYHTFDASGFEVFNLGTGNGSSVLDAIHAFEKATGKALPNEMGPRRSGDVVQIYSDCMKSNTKLGWKTRHSLEDSMKSAWNWQQRIPEFAQKYQI